MRASRRFVPSSMPALEGRVVPSRVVPTASAVAAWFRPAHLSSGEIAQSNKSDRSFGLDVSATIQNGLPVAEQVTTQYTDGSTQTESLLKIPNPTTNTVTLYETINLRNNGGTEKVVDTESFSGSTTPFSGDDNSHTITITLPNGSTESETYHEVITGHKTVVTGTIDEANGGIETWMSIKLRHGLTTTTNKTITEPNGSIEQQKSISTRHGRLDLTTITWTHLPDGAVEYSSSATDTIRVQASSS